MGDTRVQKFTNHTNVELTFDRRRQIYSYTQTHTHTYIYIYRVLRHKLFSVKVIIIHKIVFYQNESI
jgi:hypothetical protein